MVDLPLPDFVGDDPDPEWLTPKGRALLKRVRDLAFELGLSEEEVVSMALDQLEGNEPIDFGPIR